MGNEWCQNSYELRASKMLEAFDRLKELSLRKFGSNTYDQINKMIYDVCVELAGEEAKSFWRDQQHIVGRHLIHRCRNEPERIQKRPLIVICSIFRLTDIDVSLEKIAQSSISRLVVARKGLDRELEDFVSSLATMESTFQFRQNEPFRSGDKGELTVGVDLRLFSQKEQIVDDDMVLTFSLHLANAELMLDFPHATPKVNIDDEEIVQACVGKPLVRYRGSQYAAWQIQSTQNSHLSDRIRLMPLCTLEGSFFDGDSVRLTIRESDIHIDPDSVRCNIAGRNIKLSEAKSKVVSELLDAAIAQSDGWYVVSQSSLAQLQDED